MSYCLQTLGAESECIAGFKTRICDVFLTVCSFAAGRELPQDQTHRVHVYPQEGVPLEVDGPLQDLGGHVPPGPHLTHTHRSMVKTLDLVRPDQGVRSI